MDEILKLLRTLCSDQQKVLNGMESTLPEPWKSELVSLRGEFDKVLARLPETEKPSAGLAANEGINYLAYAVQRVLEINKGLTDMLKRLGTDRDEVMAGLDGRITSVIAERVTKGELFEAAAVNTAVTAAVNKAKGEWETALQLRETRRSELVACGLPLPTDVALLDAEEAAWVKARDAAKERAATCQARKLELASADVGPLLWGDAESFQRGMRLVDTVLASASGAGKAATTTASAVPDPMLGGGNNQPGAKRRLPV